MTISLRFWLAALAVITLVACSPPAEEAAVPPRPIKAYTVSEVASGQVRRFAGISEATDTAALSFQTPGNIQAVNVQVGEHVEAGAVLASLDREPYLLDVQAAQAELDRARADLDVKADTFERQQALFSKGWVSKAALDQADATYKAAVSSVDYASSRLGLAQRNLSNTQLLAPFAGTVAARQVEPFQDVQAGQKIFDMNADGALEIAFAVPEGMISGLSLGMTGSVRFSTLDGVFSARVTEIAGAATDANAFGVKASLLGATDQVRPGMTAEISLELGVSEDGGYLVPLSALMGGEEQYRGYVFRFDPDAGTVVKTPVTGQGVRDNMFIVSDGLKAGDIIAAAGVSFLEDGQAVRLMN